MYGPRLPTAVHFINEYDEDKVVPLFYEWKPSSCTNCNKLGHETKNFMIKKIRKVWMPKKIVVEEKNEEDVITNTSKGNEIDPDGFQKALRPTRVRRSVVIPVNTGNSFQTLVEADVGRKEHLADGTGDVQTLDIDADQGKGDPQDCLLECSGE